jgi:hypothetical protein
LVVHYFFFFAINIIFGHYSKRGTTLEHSRPQHTQDFAQRTLEKRKLQQEPSGFLSTTTRCPPHPPSTTRCPPPSSIDAAREKEDGTTTIQALRRYHRESAPLWTSMEGGCKQQRRYLWGSSAGENPRHSSAQGPAASRRHRRGRAPTPQPLLVVHYLQSRFGYFI